MNYPRCFGPAMFVTTIDKTRFSWSRNIVDAFYL